MQDAIISLFVPISLSDMEKLAINVSDKVNQGGYFICMLLGMLPEYKSQNNVIKRNTEHCIVDGNPVIRFNSYTKEESIINYEGIYFASGENGVKMFMDLDKYHLIQSDEKLELPAHLYRHITRIPIFGKPTQAP